MADVIAIRGARTNYLKNLQIDLPKSKISVITGVCGSGKASLALHTVYAESYLRYIQSVSPYIRQFLEKIACPQVDSIQGLPPAISLLYQRPKKNTRALLATSTDILDFLQTLFVRHSTLTCPNCLQKIKIYTETEIFSFLTDSSNEPIDIGFEYPGNISFLMNRGYYYHLHGNTKQKINASWKDKLLHVWIDRIADLRQNQSRLAEAISQSIRMKSKVVVALTANQKMIFPLEWYCFNCHQSYPPPDEKLFSFNSPQGACPYCQGTGENPGDSSRPVCPECLGSRFRKETLQYQFHDLTISGFLSLTPLQAITSITTIRSISGSDPLCEKNLSEILNRLKNLCTVGLSGLPLDRMLHTLSPGETLNLQRAILAGSQIADSLILLIHPSSALNASDFKSFAEWLDHLKTHQNTILIIDNHPEVIRLSDQVMQLGPKSGEAGGQMIFWGPTADFPQFPSPSDSIQKTVTPESPAFPITNAKWIAYGPAQANNLKGFYFKIPRYALIGLTGVSGSGKTSLLKQEIYPISLIRQDFQEILWIGADQRKRRSGQTLAELFQMSVPLRNRFANLKESQIHHFTAAHFSRHSPLGRCDHCRGMGKTELPMQFLPPLQINCEDCRGSGFKPEILKIKSQGRSICDMQNMTIEENYPELKPDLPPAATQTMEKLILAGFGYLKIGQRVNHLSAGENFLLDLFKKVQEKKKESLFLIDQPPVSFHDHDWVRIKKLLTQLKSNANTIIIVSNLPQFLQATDFLLELGPGSGEAGGEIIFQGSPSFKKPGKTSKFSEKQKKSKKILTNFHYNNNITKVL